MKKKIISVAALLTLLLSLALSGCANINALLGGEDDLPTPNDNETALSEGEGTFSYSEGLAANGFFSGVTALDYVELFDYSALPIPVEAHSVTDDELQAEIDYILESYPGEKQITDRAVADGDTVNIDYVGSVDGVEFSGGSTGGMGTPVTIGVTSYIDDFLEQLIGHMPGETFDINVTFPEDYGVDELNGKDAVFVTTVNYISEATEAELTDEFVFSNFNAYYGWSTVDDLKSAISEEFRVSAVNTYIQDYLVFSVNVSEIPESMLVYQEKALIQYYEDGAEYYSMTFDEFIATYAGVTTREELIEANIESNEQAARFYLVIQAVAEDMGLDVTNDDVTDYFLTNFYTEDFSTYEQEYGLPYLKYTVLCQKVIDHITDNAVLQ